MHIKLVWVCCIHPVQLQHLGSLILCFLASASSAAACSDRLAAVRIEGIKGDHRDVKGSMFPSLPIEDKYCTSAGPVWLLKVRCKTAARLYPHSKVGKMAELNKHDTCFTGKGGGE